MLRNARTNPAQLSSRGRAVSINSTCCGDQFHLLLHRRPPSNVSAQKKDRRERKLVGEPCRRREEESVGHADLEAGARRERGAGSADIFTGIKLRVCRWKTSSRRAEETGLRTRGKVRGKKNFNNLKISEIIVSFLVKMPQQWRQNSDEKSHFLPFH